MESAAPFCFNSKMQEVWIVKRKKIGVLLSGCGVMDGSEIHEATLTLYFLDKQGAEVVCIAPNKDQAEVMNHVAGAPVQEKRNMMIEAARIARGKIQDVTTVNAGELDAVILPGGLGAAKNLCTFAKDGAACGIDEGVAALLTEFHRAHKPIGAICIAPAVIARLFGREFSPELTIGKDPGTAAALETMGARHTQAKVDEIVVDAKNKIVSTPAYMLAQSIKEVGAGIEKLVAKIIELS
jgi:enhancing lycopene biosynthesis protein 2